MGEAASAVEAIRAQIVMLHDVCDGLSHRELVGLLAELTEVLRSVPALEHRVLARLTTETEPRRACQMVCVAVAPDGWSSIDGCDH